MAEFRIYQHPGGQIEAVKCGWSWPAFVFVGFWALYKRLWVVGTVVLILSLLLHVVFPYSLLPYVVDLTLGAVLGYLGNEWREKNLGERGYEWTSTAEATTPDGALAEHVRAGDRDGRPRAASMSLSPRRIEPTL